MLQSYWYRNWLSRTIYVFTNFSALVSCCRRFKCLVFILLRFTLNNFFFLALSSSWNPILFLLAKFVWKSKAPSKVKAFAWLVVHEKANTNDRLQLRRPQKFLNSHCCILCKGSEESIDYLFLHCPLTLGLWHELFSLAKMDWVLPLSIGGMMIIS